MTETISPYSVGDWVAHHSYGIGQIRKIEEKSIQGEPVVCFRVKTQNAAYWFPRNEADNPRIRPVADQVMLQRALGELQKTIRDLDPDRLLWKSRIDEVRASDDLIETSQLVRDLTVLRTQRKLNQTETKALNHFTDRLLREWSVSMKTDVETTQQKLNHYLQICKERASV